MSLRDIIKGIFGAKENIQKKVENRDSNVQLSDLQECSGFRIIEDFAQAWKTLDAELIVKHLDKSFLYHSQWMTDTLDYEGYVNYIRHKFDTINRTGARPTVRITFDAHSESGYMIRLQQEGIEPCIYRLTIEDSKVIKADMYACKQIEIDYQNPPELFMQVRAFAGDFLSKKMQRESPEGKPTCNGFRWIKTEWSYPSFEHFTFAYKNQLFCIVVDFSVNGEYSLDEQTLCNLLRESDRYNLVPCIFPVELVQHGDVLTPQKPHKLRNASGWNLFHAKTMLPVIPEQISDDKPTPMSNWEMLDFAIQVVKSHIEKGGGTIQSFCSVPEFYPNIWFTDKTGRTCWVVVERMPFKDPKEAAQRWYNKIGIKSILQFDGFHAAVDFHSSAPILYDELGEIIPLSKRDVESCPRYRGDSMYVYFSGLERIHVADI